MTDITTTQGQGQDLSPIKDAAKEYIECFLAVQQSKEELYQRTLDLMKADKDLLAKWVKWWESDALASHFLVSLNGKHYCLSVAEEAEGKGNDLRLERVTVL